MLDDIIKQFIEDFKSNKDNPVIVGFMPIIWFGNIDNYLNSKKRVITIGLNPSRKEFPEMEDNQRFQRMNLDSMVDSKMISDLKQNLNSYFDRKPYVNWFRWGENVLNIFGATYYTNKQNNKDFSQGIHIDIYTSIATNPTWRGLDKENKQRLSKTGLTLFKKLLGFLNPDVILVSTNKNVFNEVFVTDLGFESKPGWERYKDPTKKTSFYVRKYCHDKQLLYWIYNCNGTAFLDTKEYIERCMNELV